MAEQFPEDFFYRSDVRYFSDVSSTDSSDEEEPPTSSKQKEDDEPAISCFCGSRATKKMIGCDSGGCAIEWFHYRCVGFTSETLPAGQWMCDCCRLESKGIPVQPEAEKATPKKNRKQAASKKKSKEVKKATTRKKKPVQCLWCGLWVGSKVSLNRHRRNFHENQRLLKCKGCPKKFIDKEQLKIHYQKWHTTEGIADCIICGQEFLKARQLRLHHRKHTGERSHRCDLCGQGFVLKFLLRKHIEEDHKDGEVPPEDVVVVSVNGLATERHNYAQKDRIFKCGSCGLLFDKEMDLVIHQVDHQIAGLDGGDD
ncbi:uncharacterized protein [Asterias amurensis]|uniref:uncharacterized protein n=1 Tax=Asterias amurensis TaxID=7602 RepID=UPI003AB4BC86